FIGAVKALFQIAYLYHSTSFLRKNNKKPRPLLCAKDGAKLRVTTFFRLFLTEKTSSGTAKMLIPYCCNGQIRRNLTVRTALYDAPRLCSALSLSSRPHLAGLSVRRSRAYSSLLSFCRFRLWADYILIFPRCQGEK